MGFLFCFSFSCFWRHREGTISAKSLGGFFSLESGEKTQYLEVVPSGRSPSWVWPGGEPPLGWQVLPLPLPPQEWGLSIWREVDDCRPNRLPAAPRSCKGSCRNLGLKHFVFSCINYWSGSWWNIVPEPMWILAGGVVKGLGFPFPLLLMGRHADHSNHCGAYTNVLMETLVQRSHSGQLYSHLLCVLLCSWGPGEWHCTEVMGWWWRVDSGSWRGKPWTWTKRKLNSWNT